MERDLILNDVEYECHIEALVSRSKKVRLVIAIHGIAARSLKIVLLLPENSFVVTFLFASCFAFL